MWTVHDISERAQVERARSEFVAMASHELRSPLTSIKGFVELLARSGENMSDRQREFVDIILRSTDRLAELVGDLLDVARIDAGRIEIDKRPIDVGEAVREVVELMGPRIEAKGQQLGVYLAPTLPLALADPQRVRQMLANLLTNAHLYTPEGGRIHIGAEAERAWVQIVVGRLRNRADRGEQRERVFERFYRASEAGRLGPGTGLGLSIVKSLVEMHRRPDRGGERAGSGIDVHDPAAGGDPRSPLGRSLEAIQGSRVLIVDDEREVAELIARQLAPLEVQTEIALQRRRGSGARALATTTTRSWSTSSCRRWTAWSWCARFVPSRSCDSFRSCSSPCSPKHPELAGEWFVPKPIDAEQLREVLGAAVSAGRSRVLVVARESLQPTLEPALDDLGIEHEWETSGAAAARVCGERRFEIALVDVGIRNPQAVLQALDLRGRRLRRCGDPAAGRARAPASGHRSPGHGGHLRSTRPPTRCSPPCEANGPPERAVRLPGRYAGTHAGED